MLDDVRLWVQDPSLLQFHQWRAVDLPVEEAEIRLSVRDALNPILTDEEFQHSLAMVLSDDEQAFRAMARADLESEQEYLERTIAELAADHSDCGDEFWLAVQPRYEQRLRRIQDELQRRDRFTGTLGHLSKQRIPEGFVQSLKREWKLHEAMNQLFPHIITHRMANNYLALCPFHSERTPSMVIYADHFHCFGCGQSGDVIDLMQTIDGGNWVDAVLRVAERLHVSIPDPTPYHVAQQQGSIYRQPAVRFVDGV